MFESYDILGLFTETSLHPGSGSTTGSIDLPVQRDKVTSFPIIPASGLKGAMREVANKNSSNSIVNIIFGSAESDYGGSLAITDARILAFPVRSLNEVYVWVTCPMVLHRFKRDMALLNDSNGHFPDIDIEEGKFIGFSNSYKVDKLILEELSFEIDNGAKVDEVQKYYSSIEKLLPSNDVFSGTRDRLNKLLFVISNNDFKHLVNHATQVTARNNLDDEKKTSKNLWYEETIPSETLFYTLLLAMKPRTKDSNITNGNKIMEELRKVIKDYIQIGGNETLGMGWCAVKYYNGGGN